jgi:hypothetical protein
MDRRFHTQRGSLKLSRAMAAAQQAEPDAAGLSGTCGWLIASVAVARMERSLGKTSADYAIR